MSSCGPECCRPACTWRWMGSAASAFRCPRNRAGCAVPNVRHASGRGEETLTVSIRVAFYRDRTREAMRRDREGSRRSRFVPSGPAGCSGCSPTPSGPLGPPRPPLGPPRTWPGCTWTWWTAARGRRRSSPAAVWSPPRAPRSAGRADPAVQGETSTTPASGRPRYRPSGAGPHEASPGNSSGRRTGWMKRRQGMISTRRGDNGSPTTSGDRCRGGGGGRCMDRGTPTPLRSRWLPAADPDRRRSRRCFRSQRAGSSTNGQGVVRHWAVWPGWHVGLQRRGGHGLVPALG